MQPLIHPHTEDLEQIAASVFSTMLGLEFQSPAATAACPSSANAITAAVHLAGTWDGTLLLHCMGTQAREFAARFLGMPLPVSIDSDVRDVLGELANMIAGNLKCTLRPGIQLSQPSVVDGLGQALRGAGRVVCELGFDTDGGPFWLCAVEKGSPA